MDLNRDGHPEMILWKTRYDIQPRVYVRRGAAWSRVGYLTYSKAPTTAIDIQTQLITEGVTSKPSAWNELSVGTIRYQVLEDEAAR